MSNQVEMNSEQGKQTVESLMAKMSPEQQVEFQAALAADKPVHVHIGKDGAVSLGDAATEAAEAAGGTPEEELPPAPEAPTELKREEPKKPSKLELKRQEILRDRVKRHMGKGLDQNQALQAIQKEDFDSLPLDKKFNRLENMVAQSFQRLASEVMDLNQGHMAIADAFDINYRAIQKLFTKLGVSDEDQKNLIEEAQKEVIAAKTKIQEDRAKAQVAQMKAQADASEQARIEAQVKADGSSSALPEGAEIPKEATIFGG